VCAIFVSYINPTLSDHVNWVTDTSLSHTATVLYKAEEAQLPCC